jgi:hypothetical protein
VDLGDTGEQALVLDLRLFKVTFSLAIAAFICLGGYVVTFGRTPQLWVLLVAES